MEPARAATHGRISVVKILLALLSVPVLLTGCSFVEGRDTHIRENVIYEGRSRLTAYPRAVGRATSDRAISSQRSVNEK